MRVVARAADIWNFWESPSAEVYAQKLLALQRHCDEVGRDPSKIRKSVHIKPVVGETEAEVKERGPAVARARSFETCEQISERLLDFVRLGLSDFVYMLDEPCDFRTLELLATRVAPYVREEGDRILAESTRQPRARLTNPEPSPVLDTRTYIRLLAERHVNKKNRFIVDRCLSGFLSSVRPV